MAKDLRDLENFLNQLPAKLQEATELTLQKSALEIEARIKEQFKTEGEAYGEEWKPVKEKYLRWKRKKGYSEKTLHRTTTLSQSFSSVVKPFEARIGTEVEYAIYHELGTRKMVARPFAKPVAEKFQEQRVAENFFISALDMVLKDV
jgi:phage virion morphogenesis (putative tail completion) protein